MPKFKVEFEGKTYQLRRLTFDKKDRIRGVQFRFDNDLRYLRLDSGRIKLYILMDNEDWKEIL